MIIRVNHIAVAVRSIAEALPLYTEGLGLEFDRRGEVPAESVYTAHVRVGEATIELVEPYVATSIVGRWLSTRGESIHHICLEVADLEGDIAAFRARGVRLIETPAEAGAAQGTAYIHPHSTKGVLVQLAQAR